MKVFTPAFIGMSLAFKTCLRRDTTIEDMEGRL